MTVKLAFKRVVESAPQAIELLLWATGLIYAVKSKRAHELLLRVNTKYVVWKDKRAGYWSAYREAKRLLFTGADRDTIRLVVKMATKAKSRAERKTNIAIIVGMLK
jgi:hypothetical protein